MIHSFSRASQKCAQCCLYSSTTKDGRQVCSTSLRLPHAIAYFFVMPLNTKNPTAINGGGRESTNSKKGAAPMSGRVQSEITHGRCTSHLTCRKTWLRGRTVKERCEHLERKSPCDCPRWPKYWRESTDFPIQPVRRSIVDSY